MFFLWVAGDWWLFIKLCCFIVIGIFVGGLCKRICTIFRFLSSFWLENLKLSGHFTLKVTETLTKLLPEKESTDFIKPSPKLFSFDSFVSPTIFDSVYWVNLWAGKELKNVFEAFLQQSPVCWTFCPILCFFLLKMDCSLHEIHQEPLFTNQMPPFSVDIFQYHQKQRMLYA